MAQLNPFLIAIIIVSLIIAIILLLLVFFPRDNNSDTGSGGVQCTTVPSIPTGVIASNPEIDIIAVSWNSVVDADTYRVYLDTNPGFSISNAQEVRSTSQTSISFGDLETGVTYYLKVTGFSSCGESQPSSEVSVTIPFFWPNRFQIVNNDDPTIDVSNTFFFSVTATTNCNPSDCWWSYNDIDKTIRKQTANTVCLTNSAGTAIATLCNVSLLQDRQWDYNVNDNTLCLVSDSNKCIKLQDGFTNPGSLGSQIEVGPPTGTFLTEWQILDV